MISIYNIYYYITTLLYSTLLIHVNVILRIHTSYITLLLLRMNVLHKGNTYVIPCMHSGGN